MEVKPKIEFLTANKLLLKNYPIVPAAQMLPQWFKDMPHNETGLRVDSTAKNCPGIVDYMVSGYMVPLWTDYMINVSPEGIMNCQGTWDKSFDFFQESQTKGLVPGTEITKGAIKLTSPWSVRTAPGWSIMCLSPFYNMHIPEFNVMPGFVGTDTLHILNIIMTPNFMNDTVLLKAGTPILHIIPFRRQNTKPELKLVDGDEWAELQSSGKGGIVGTDRLIMNAYRQGVRLNEKNRKYRYYQS